MDSKYAFPVICIGIVLGLLTASATAMAADSWSVSFTTSLNSYPEDGFEAGFSSIATDGYDPFADAFQMASPGGAYTMMMTQVGPYPLTKDIRSAADSKTWEIVKLADDTNGIGLTGTDGLTWTTSNVPSDMDLALIDYGADPTRTSVVQTIDLKATSSYNVAVTNVNGYYRYMDMVATKQASLEGDVNGDCRVNIFDLVTVAIAYGSSPGDPRWNPDADLKDDGRINIFDLVIVAINYGDEC